MTASRLVDVLLVLFVVGWLGVFQLMAAIVGICPYTYGLLTLGITCVAAQVSAVAWLITEALEARPKDHDL